MVDPHEQIFEEIADRGHAVHTSLRSPTPDRRNVFSPSPSLSRNLYSLGVRLVCLLLLMAAQLVIATIAFDGASLSATSGANAFLRNWGPWIPRFAVGFAAIFLGFGFMDKRGPLKNVAVRLSATSVQWWLLAAQVPLFGLFLYVGRGIYGAGEGNPASGINIFAWAVLGAASALCVLLGVVPLSIWGAVIRGTGSLWAWAAGASLVACGAIHITQTLWIPTARVTFGLVVWVLRPLLPDMRTNLAILQIGTGEFSVRIAPECSGLEGMALLTVLGSLWLGIFRKEYRFPQAILLLPVGVGVLFLANIVRLSTLILLGAAGAQEVALGGFHSQAGWISFNAIAFGLCAISRKIAWTSSPESLRAVADALPGAASREMERRDDINPVAPYLMPFLAMLAASMLATASSGSFEWLYPLRFFAAAIAIWVYRKQYSQISWSFDRGAVAAGVGVFVFWIAMDRLTTTGSKGMPRPLVDATASLRWGWIALRALAGVVATPIAEELAFRGFALRRLIRADFESVPFLQANLFTGTRSGSDHAVWLGLVGSSVIFGVLHGGHWFAGAIAGAAYGIVMLRSGRLGNAIAAHAVTNACLAATALIANRWDLWG